MTLFAPDGRLLSTVRPAGRGNGNVRVLSVAVDTDGTLAIGWWDEPNMGIEYRDLSGNLIRSIDTGQYYPEHLAFGQDHSLWSFGWEQQAARPHAHAQGYMTVRKYSADGQQAGAYLPRSLFPPGLEPSEAGGAWQSRRITVTAQRVGVDAASGNTGNQREWVELDLNGNLIGRWRLDPQSEVFPGVALTSDGQAYVQRHAARGSGQVFRLDRESSTWQAVTAPAGQLYGADGDQLVFAESSHTQMHTLWYLQPAF